MNHPTLSRSRSKLNRRFASFYKKSLYYISLMSYVKSFKELDRKRRCFSFAGAKVDTFHNMTKHSGNFFQRNLKKNQDTLLYIIIGQEKGWHYVIIDFGQPFSLFSNRAKYFHSILHTPSSSTIGITILSDAESA
jgi:hypothetical protein